MATRKPKEESIDEEVEQAKQILSVLGDDSFTAESLNPALESLYAEMGMSEGMDATVHISKLDADGKGLEANVGKCAPDEYDLEQIAKKYGSGQYRVKVYVRIPTGQKVLKGNKVFAWLLSPEEELKRASANQPQVQMPAFNMQAMQTEVARAVSDAVRAVIPMIAPQPAPSPLEMMKEVAQVMQLMRPLSEPQQPATNPLAMMKDVVEMMNMMRGDQEPLERGVNAGPTDLLMAVVNKFGPLLANALPAQTAQQVQTAQPMQQAPQLTNQPITQQAPIPPEPQLNTEENEMLLKLKMGLAFLRRQCDAGGNPVTYAELVLDSVPDDTLSAMFAQPNPIEYLAQFDAQLNNEPYKSWFAAVITECKGILAGGTDQEESPPQNPIAP